MDRYKEIRKKVLVVLRNPASTNSKLEDRLTKLTLEAIAEALEELQGTVQISEFVSSSPVSVGAVIYEMTRKIQSEITTNTK